MSIRYVFEAVSLVGELYFESILGVVGGGMFDFRF